MKKLKFSLIFGITCVLTMSQLQFTAMANVERTTGVVCPVSGLHIIPDPSSCDSFYLCINGVPKLQHCALGLKFDIASNSCNLPEYTTCADLPIIEP